MFAILCSRRRNAHDTFLQMLLVLDPGASEPEQGHKRRYQAMQNDNLLKPNRGFSENEGVSSHISYMVRSDAMASPQQDWWGTKT